jgi:hypothetical protein
MVGQRPRRRWERPPMVSNPHLISVGYKIDFGIRTILPTWASSSQVLSFEQS